MFKFIQRLFLLGVLITPLFCSAQYNFFKGYVVTNAGDTLKGYVQGKESNSNPTSVKFKSTVDGKAEQYFVKDLKAFSVADKEKYERYFVDISLDKVALEELSVGVDTSFTQKEVFLKVLQLGEKMDLYLYADDLKTRFYIREKGVSTPVELKRHLYLDPNNRSNLVEGFEFRGVLYNLFSKYDLLKNNDQSAFKIPYEESAISNLISLLNEKEDLPKSPYAKYSFFVGLGLNSTSASYGGTHYLAHAGTVHKSSLSPYLTIGIDVYANPAYRRTFFRTQFGFFYDKQNIERAVDDYSINAIVHSYKRYNADLTLQVLHNFYNSPKIKAYIGAGFSLNYTFASVNKFEYRYLSTGASSQPAPDLEKFYYSIPVKAGLFVNKKIEISLSYHIPAAITRYLSYSIKEQRFGAGVNYSFR